MVMMDGCPTSSPSPRDRPSAVSQEMLNHRLRAGGSGEPRCVVSASSQCSHSYQG